MILFQGNTPQGGHRAGTVRRNRSIIGCQCRREQGKRAFDHEKEPRINRHVWRSYSLSLKFSILYEKVYSQCFILPFDDSNRFHQRSILFAFYGVCQKFVANVAGVGKVENLSTFQNGTSGFLAAFFSSLALCPTELVKCRFVIPQYMLFHPCRSWGLNKIITR